MASVTNKDIPEEFKAFSEFFIFRKKFYNGEDSEDFWAELIDTADELSKAHNSDYLDQMILVCVDDIDRRYMASIGRTRKSDPVKNVYERIQKRKGMPV